MVIKKNILPGIIVKSEYGDQKFSGSWYRGKHCNFIPNKKNLNTNENFIKDYILKGYLPKQPVINKNNKIIAFGSCFAFYVSQYLTSMGYSVLNKKRKNDGNHIVRYGEGMANTFTVIEQLEWIFEKKEIEKNTWYYSPDKEIEKNEDVRNVVYKLLSQINVFIITVGLSEVWYNKTNKQVFWKAIPADKFDENKHGFRLSSVEENTNNLQNICLLIKKHLPKAKIIFTLSPVPLMATFRSQSCITANSISKSILRVALDNVITKNYDNTYYFPAYEITKEYFVDPFGEDNRHLKDQYIKKIMEIFLKYYCI
jgi:hypothetical protein|tara:strand:- start:237 stop:1172 length:936 start_codon:yes stop_codon:yes gene_type:complete